MTASSRPQNRLQPWWVWPPIAVALVVTAAATATSLGFYLLVNLQCGNWRGTGNIPCQSALTWVPWGLAAQVVLLLGVVVLAVTAASRRCSARAVSCASLAVGVLSFAVYLGTGELYDSIF